MKNLSKKQLLLTSLLSGVAFSFAFAPAYAQTQSDEPIILDTVEEDEGDDGDEIVVTGSRLKRNEFTSASPLKILNINEALASGVVDTASVVQRSSVAGGTQFDNTFTGQVTDSGPGSSTVSLRGLDAERTLVLSNGRRIAPAGVRGAPTRPDLNLIPLASIERIDLLTEGASSIYGSDAVAGVVNVITKKEFDGIEVDLFHSNPVHGGGDTNRLSLSTGMSGDKGYIGLGFEYLKQDKVTRGQRDFTPCDRDIEVNPATGERREICRNGLFGNMFLDPINLFFGAGGTNDGLGAGAFGVYGFDFDNGSGFTLIPSNNQPGGPGTALRITWVYDNRYNNNRDSHLFDLAQGTERYSAFVDGEYSLDMLGNATAYFEGLYSTRAQEIFSGPAQIFPSVPCSNPFIQNDPVLSATPVCSSPFANHPVVGQLVWLPHIPAQQGPINLDVTATRAVAGLRGDLESVIPTGSFNTGGENFGFNFGNFTYDAWLSFDVNRGVDSQRTLNEERTSLALTTVVQNVDGSYSCGTGTNDLFGFISEDTCVPIDITDANIYINGVLPQDFLDYASGLETTTTNIKQKMFQASIAGDVAYLPAGTVPFAMGVEYREDSIATRNSYLITSGAGTNGRLESDTLGDTSLLEVFFETSLPILKGQKLAEELTVNLAARWTEEENFGALWTYRAQGVYRPTDWFTARASFGTTYRAPNLREQNLAGQLSFTGAFADPCIASNIALLDPNDVARVSNNCILQGADPTRLGQGGATSIPTVTGGTKALNAETSEGLTAGFVVEQPWFDSFDLNLAVTYFKIDIEQSIEEPSAGFILNECLVLSTNLDSPFCNLIERNTNVDPARNFISQIDSSFVNVGLITTDGVDVDILLSKDFTFGGNELEFSTNLSASNVMKNKRDLFNTITSFDGRPYLPHWSGDIQTRLGYRDFEMFWNARYIGRTEDDDIDALRANDIVNTNTGETFFFAGFRDVEETPSQILHDVSFAYNQDTWTAQIGVRNVFDKEPPLVDSGEGYFTSDNAVIGAGFDIYGRTFFARMTKKF